MDFKRAPYVHVLLIAIELAFAANIIFIDILVFRTLSNYSKPTAESTRVQNTQHVSLSDNIQQVSTSASQMTGMSQKQISRKSDTSDSPSIQSVPIIVSPVKEFFVPLGSGQGSGTDWTDIPGLQANLNPNNYPNIKQVVFEVSAQIPTGNQTATIRLFNKTAQHSVWFSDVSLSGGDARLLISQPITLDSGSNTYQVQIRTQLGYQTNIAQSRIHITVN